MAATLGLRRGELLGLRWSDLDLDLGTAAIGQTLQRAGGKLRPPGRCPDCGAGILTACRHCGLRIRGTSRSRVLRPGLNLSPDYSPPSFCDGCGDPYPWASRQARIFQLENLLDEEDIDEAARLVVTEHLRQLQELAPDDDPEREQRLWKSVRRHAPGLFAGAGRQILTTVIDLTTRRAIGMDS